MKSFIIFLTITATANGSLLENLIFQNINNTITANKTEFNLNVKLSELYSREYDDRLCLQQFTAFLSGLQTSNYWALAGL